MREGYHIFLGSVVKTVGYLLVIGESVHLEYGIRNGTAILAFPRCQTSKRIVLNSEMTRNFPLVQLPQNKSFFFFHIQFNAPNLRFFTLPDFEYHYFSVPNRQNSKGAATAAVIQSVSQSVDQFVARSHVKMSCNC